MQLPQKVGHVSSGGNQGVSWQDVFLSPVLYSYLNPEEGSRCSGSKSELITPV